MRRSIKKTQGIKDVACVNGIFVIEGGKLHKQDELIAKLQRRYPNTITVRERRLRAGGLGYMVAVFGPYTCCGNWPDDIRGKFVRAGLSVDTTPEISFLDKKKFWHRQVVLKRTGHESEDTLAKAKRIKVYVPWGNQEKKVTAPKPPWPEGELVDF